MNIAVMSVTKPFTITSTQIPSSARHRRHLRSSTLAPIKSSSSESKNATSNNGSGNASPPAPPSPDAVEIRFRRGSRRRSRQQQKEQDGGATNGLPKKAEPKEWKSMTITEKAVELYVGEKGLLFWLNKFAYASIFIIIGAWILFRFIGPALNLYQLDSTPLPPTSMFKGS